VAQERQTQRERAISLEEAADGALQTSPQSAALPHSDVTVIANRGE
jgi:hypothetical protein